MADEIRILAAMLKTFAGAVSSERVTMESGCDTSPDRHTPVQEPVLAIVQKGWPIVSAVAANHCNDKVNKATMTMMKGFLLLWLELTRMCACSFTEYLGSDCPFAVRSDAS
jgi:hypothetical protein